MSSAKFLLLLCLFGTAVAAQPLWPQSSPGSNGPQVSFTFDFPGSVPDHYALTVDSSGKAVYVSGKPAPSNATQKDGGSDSDTETVSEAPTKFEFTMSQATRKRIFDLAKRADYFKGDIDSGKSNLANTGKKTLSYRDGGRSSEATYNYSSKPAVQELTQLLQSISSTLEFGLRLDYLHHYQKLALDEQLKDMESAANAGQLGEIQAVAPVLKKIADDPTVMNVSRVRAERLLAGANAGAVAK